MLPGGDPVMEGVTDERREVERSPYVGGTGNVRRRTRHGRGDRDAQPDPGCCAPLVAVTTTMATNAAPMVHTHAVKRVTDLPRIHGPRPMQGHDGDSTR